MFLSRAFRRMLYQIWASQQYPDPEIIYRRGGIGDVVRYLSACGSADHTTRILRRFGAKIDPEAKPIGPRVTIHEVTDGFRNLEVGRNAHIGCEVFLDLTDRIVIEEAVTVGMRSILLTHLNLGDGYPNKPTSKIFVKSCKPTILKRGCSIGAGAIILQGVTVGEDSIVGAGVVVSKTVPPRTVVSSTQQKKDYRIPDRWFEKAGSISELPTE